MASNRSDLRSDITEEVIKAATKKAELKCKTEALRRRLALEREQFSLQIAAKELEQKMQLLSAEAELEMEEAKMAVLVEWDTHSSRRSSSRHSSLPDSHKEQDYEQQWVDLQDKQQIQEPDTNQLPSSQMPAQGPSMNQLTSQMPVQGPSMNQPTSQMLAQGPSMNQPPSQMPAQGPSMNQPTSQMLAQGPSIYRPMSQMPAQGPSMNRPTLTSQRYLPMPAPGSNMNRPTMTLDGSNHDRSENRPTSRMEEIMMKQNDLTRLLADHQLKATLPQHRMLQFSGDCLQYATFIKSFELGVENKTTSNVDRLHYLDQYTSGEPNNLVKGCLLFDDPEEGYEKAKELLKKTYGNSHKIAESFMRKAQNWPEIKPEDGAELNRFSLFMVECLTMMKSLQALSELNHTKSIQALVSKLPYRLKISWRTTACRIDEEEERRVEFQDFVRFVERQARILTNPTFGKIEHKRNVENNQPNNKFKKNAANRGAFAVSVEEKTCLFCGENSKHILKECRKFASQDSKSKSEFCFKSGLCFGCLRNGHMKKKCPQPEKCEKCMKNHPTVLHIDNFKQQQSSSQQQQSRKQLEDSPTIKTTTSCLGMTSQGNSSPRMAIVPVVVKLSNADTSVATYAFLDDGCGAVFVEPSLCEALNAKTRKRNLLLRTLNSTEVLNSAVVEGGMLVTGMDQLNSIILPEVYVKSGIPVAVKDMPSQDDIDKYSHLLQLRVPELQGDIIIPKVTIMIGSNVPECTTPMDTMTGEFGDPYAIKTPLGWVVHGMPGKLQEHVTVNFCQTEVTDGLKDLEQIFKSYIRMDFNESLSDDRAGMSHEDKRFLKVVEDGIEFKDGNYHIGLPLRNDNLLMPDNRQMAQSRAENLKRRFLKDPKYRAEYKAAMDKVIQGGYAERVPDNEQVCDGKKWYIPHHGVIHPQKQKLRVVYDCAAEYHGTSLNKELMQGPDLTNSLVGVLLRFRHEPFAILSDIEAMFYQVKVKDTDCNFLRFLWWPDGDTSKPLQDYRMLVHIFGATSSPACANYALQRTADDNRSHFDVEVVDTLHHNFYVDDCLKSLPTETKAIDLAQDLRSICQKGGFHLTKWVSNSKKVLQSIPADERAETTRRLDLDDALPSLRALGMLWCMESDCFRFNIDVSDKPSTRRGMLSVLSSVYDPLGLVSPAILPAKAILQDLCKQKIGWDEKVPSTHERKWDKWTASLPELEQIRIDRCLKPQGFEDLQSVQVHHFSGASEKGYGTASYLRVTSSNGDIECNLIMSKSRVAPLKQISIPRMELSAATVAVKIDAMLKREMDFHVNETVFWTDSETVLKYIKNEKARYPVFVANRVSIIRDGSDVGQWKHVPGKFNPADHASRGLSVSRLISLQREWLKGPDFLKEAVDNWSEFHHDGGLDNQTQGNAVPGKDDSAATNDAVVSEDQPDGEFPATATVSAVVVEEQEERILKDDPLNRLVEHYSDWTHLRRAIAWLLRLKQILLQRSKEVNQTVHMVRKGPLTVEELDHAEFAIIKTIQEQCFPDELKLLQKLQKSSTEKLKKGSSLARLDPVLKEGMICVGGRLRNADIPEQAKHQIILPKNHPISTLVIRHTHQRLRHQGRSHVLAEIRRKYWIINAGVSIKKEVKRCVICRRVKATVSTQKMSDLPAGRLQADEPPFTYTGIDYFGPFYIKQGRTIRKRYGVVFTCMASRAVHLEVAGSMDTDACINAIRRFVARRGQVKQITSDNGTNLVGANEELRRAFKDLDKETLHRFSANNGITWKFNPPAASHQGGIWERQIRTIRKILNAILLEQHLKTCRSEEELYTFLCEVESVINSRPLTRVTDDPADMNVITPKDLLLLAPSKTPPPGCFNERDTYARRRWRQVQYLADVFWKRWTKEYLPSLQERQKWLQPTRNLQVGDIVLVVDDKAPRSSWLMGRVEEAFTGNQGLVRSASIRTKTSLLTRPVSKLCMLLEQDS